MILIEAENELEHIALRALMTCEEYTKGRFKVGVNGVCSGPADCDGSTLVHKSFQVIATDFGER